MLRLTSCLLSLVILGLIIVSFPGATQTLGGRTNPLQAHPRDRIAQLINDQLRTVLTGNRHPLARREYDVGAAKASYRMDRMIMLLKADTSQQKALDELVQAQHDPESPQYHQWLTPESYGQLFGISDNDLAQTVNWLQTHGMSVEEVTAGRRAIVFSGTAAQVNSAFHAQIHLYRVGGLGSVDANVMVTHWADALVAPGFQFSAATSSLIVPAGSNASVSLTITATGGFTSAVSLSVSGLPAGASAGFAPANVSLGSGTFVLNLTVASSASVGSYPVSVVATGGGLTKTESLILTVTVPPTYALTATPASLTIPIGQKGSVKVAATASSTFNSAITFSLSGVPAGMTASFAPVSIAVPGSGTSTLSLSAQTVTPGSYALVVTGAGGGISRTSTLAVNIPGFILSTSGTAASLAPNGRASFTLTTRALNGFNSAVAFSSSGLPSGVTASFSPQRINAPGSGSSTLTLARGATSNTTAARVIVTAAGGGLSQTQTIPLNLTANQGSRRTKATSF
jgi:hypothetical protein